MAKHYGLMNIFGSERVETDKLALSEFARDQSFVAGKTPHCVVKPKDVDEILALVRLANEQKLSLIPCSSKPPRFRGDTVPSVTNAVMVDLSGMDRIVRIDARAKVAMIEPGVTFDQLQDAANAQGLRVVMPLLPRRTKSVLGAYLEREPNTIPKYHWDMSDPLCCIEIVFGAGEIFRTGSAAGPGTLEQQWASKQAQKSPMGPNQTDFLKLVHGSQGTMGIVSWSTVKLELKPTVQESYFVAAASLESLLDFTYAIVKPRYTDEVLILNKLDLASLYARSPSEINLLAAKLPEWILMYSIAGYQDLPEKRVRYLTLDIEDQATKRGIVPVQNLESVSAARLADMLAHASQEPYWKLRLKGACEDIFFITTLDRTPEFVAAVKEEAQRARLAASDIGVYIQPIQQGRNVHMEFNLMYPDDDAAAVKKIKAFHKAASRRCMDMGGFFNRPYGPWAEMVYKRCPDTVSALRKVKSIFDPNRVMNPGKLCYE